jgi:2-polyprenyl-6-hydroxyphenyl methylase/3-demethylubiquinone-9 3-methyltransferase
MAHEDAVAFHSARVQEFADQYRKSPAFRQRFDVWRRLIERYGSHDIDAVDVGSGVGTFTVEAARWCRSATGFDASAEMVEKARSSADASNASFQQADILEIDHTPVGLVLCSSVLEYVPDLPASLRVLQRLVAPGGHLIVSLPNRHAPIRTVERALFRITGRPAYLRHVRHMHDLNELSPLLPELQPVESVVYGRAGGLYAAVFSR